MPPEPKRREKPKGVRTDVTPSQSLGREPGGTLQPAPSPGAPYRPDFVPVQLLHRLCARGGLVLCLGPSRTWRRAPKAATERDWGLLLARKRVHCCAIT